MFLIPYILTALVGLLAGWLMNVIAERWPYPERPLFGRFRCTVSGENLAWRDVIPLFGYLLQRGKCRHCGKPIPWRFPAVEITAAVLFAWAWPLYENDSLYVYIVNAFYIFLFGTIALIDWRFRLIFPVMVWFGCFVGVVLAFVLPTTRAVGDIAPKLPTDLWSVFFGAVICGGIFYLIYVVAYGVYKKRALGFGDVLLAILIGVTLGFPRAVPALLLGAVMGGFAAAAFFIIRRRGRLEFIPYGTTLCLGVIFILVWGQAIWRFGPFGLVADLFGLLFQIVFQQFFKTNSPV